jgi:hypothetical protein
MGAVQKIDAQEIAQSNVVTPAEMIKQAIASGSGVEVMERLLALQERHDAFQARKAFDDAMADLRRNLPRITKSQEVDFTSKKTGDRTNYKFEDLAEITEALSPVMADVGLSFRWYTDNVQGGVKVTCRITHRDGHFEETSLVGPLDASGSKNPIQAIGSAVTYLQRYTLKAAVGIAAARDDDAQEVSRQTDAAPRVSKDQEARSIYTHHESALRRAATKDELRAAWQEALKDKDRIPADWQRDLRRELDDRLAELGRAPAIEQHETAAYVDPNESLDRQFAETVGKPTQAFGLGDDDIPF